MFQMRRKYRVRPDISFAVQKLLCPNEYVAGPPPVLLVQDLILRYSWPRPDSPRSDTVVCGWSWPVIGHDSDAYIKGHQRTWGMMYGLGLA